MKLWYGEEQEGVFRGVKSLFVGSDKVTFVEIKKYVDEYQVEQLYFGAGGCTKINHDVLRRCIKDIFLIITAEIELEEIKNFPKDLLEGVLLIVTIKSEDVKVLAGLDDEGVQVKLLGGGKLLITEKNWFEEVDLGKLKGEMYEGDKVLIE